MLIFSDDFFLFLGDFCYLVWSSGFCKTCKFVEKIFKGVRLKTALKLVKKQCLQQNE